MITKPYWTDSWTDRVIENHKPSSDGTKNYASATTRLQSKVTLVSRQRQSGAEMKILGSLYLTLRVKTDPWINEMINMKLKELVRNCMRTMERKTSEYSPRIKFDNDEVIKLLGPKRVLSVSTHKRVGEDTTVRQHVLHSQVDKQLHDRNLHHGMSDNFFNGLKMFPLADNDVSLVSDGWCTQDFKPARSVAFPHTLFFLRSVLCWSSQCLSASLTCMTCACHSRQVTTHTWGVVSSQEHLPSH